MPQTVENKWSGREDSNLRPLPPEDKIWLQNAQNYVERASEMPERAANKGDVLRDFTGDAPDGIATTQSDTIATDVRAHAERIMKAAGLSLIHPSPQSHRVLSAVMDCYEQAYRAGAKFGADWKGQPHD